MTVDDRRSLPLLQGRIMPRRTAVDPQFPRRLRELRRMGGLSQQDLAHRAFVAKSHISELENGIKGPSVATAKALDGALAVNGELAALVHQLPATADQRGGPESLDDRALRYHHTMPETVDTIIEIGRADVKRRSIITAPFVLAALAAPSRDWLLSSLDSVSDESGPRRIGMAGVDAIRQAFALFQEMDVMRGGGHARVALVEYMNNHVLPLVRRDHGNEQTQLALYEAASEQAYLVGWMAYDDGLQGLAQRYLIQALRLAQASKNIALGAHVLAGMSDQTNLLGNPREGLTLARAGRRGITTEDSAACLADLYVLEARALAALGDAPAAAHAVTMAESVFEKVDRSEEPEWARFIDEAYLFGEVAHAFRDLGEPAQVDRFATESAEAAAGQQRARRGAMSRAALATGLLARGEVEAAAHEARLVVDLSVQVNSSRCLEAVQDLTEKLKPYASVPEVETFHNHARDHLTSRV